MDDCGPEWKGERGAPGLLCQQLQCRQGLCYALCITEVAKRSRQPLPCLALLGWSLGANVVLVLVARVERTGTSGPGRPPLCLFRESQTEGSWAKQVLSIQQGRRHCGSCWATPVYPLLYLSLLISASIVPCFLSQISTRMGTFLRSRGCCQCHTQQVVLIDRCRATWGGAAVHSQGSLPWFSLPVAHGDCRLLFWDTGMEVSEGYEGSLCLWWGDGRADGSAYGSLGSVHYVPPGRASLHDKASLRLEQVRSEDQGWYECKVLMLDQQYDTFHNGSWVHLTINGALMFLSWNGQGRWPLGLIWRK